MRTKKTMWFALTPKMTDLFTIAWGSFQASPSLHWPQGFSSRTMDELSGFVSSNSQGLFHSPQLSLSGEMPFAAFVSLKPWSPSVCPSLSALLMLGRLQQSCWALQQWNKPYQLSNRAGFPNPACPEYQVTGFTNLDSPFQACSCVSGCELVNHHMVHGLRRDFSTW